MRFVFPHAPVRPVTVNAGMRMRAWYDILDMDADRRVEIGELIASAERVSDLIERERTSGMASERIFLAGYSQGGAVALHAGLRYPEPLAGILAMSTYMPTADSLESERSPANAGVPIMMAHGTMDTVVRVGRGIRARQALKRLGYSVAWHEYPIMHAVCPQEIRDIDSWLKRLMEGLDGTTPAR
jgi:phospholipase/carboxylesterase